MTSSMKTGLNTTIKLEILKRIIDGKPVSLLIDDLKPQEIIQVHQFVLEKAIEFGKIVKNQWMWLENNFNYIRLYKFVVMPNHIHGIIVIDRFNTGKIVRTGPDLSYK